MGGWNLKKFAINRLGGCPTRAAPLYFNQGRNKRHKKEKPTRCLQRVHKGAVANSPISTLSSLERHYDLVSDATAEAPSTAKFPISEHPPCINPHTLHRLRSHVLHRDSVRCGSWCLTGDASILPRQPEPHIISISGFKPQIIVLSNGWYLLTACMY